jgi:mono/diheme cytochrome c family protein
MEKVMRPVILTGAIFLSMVLFVSGGENPPIDSMHGPALYQSYCASCHGMDGRGGGHVAKSLKGPVPDLTLISARNKGTFPAAHLAKVISGDDLLPGAHGSQDMPVWGSVFSRVGSDPELGRKRIDNLIQYLREIQKPPESKK